MNWRSACPVCESGFVEQFLTRKDVPVHQNLILRDQQAAVALERGDLSLAFCRDCGFVFNRSFDLARISYGEQYDNTQSHSRVFSDYIDELVGYLVCDRKVQNCRIVEIGCGKGAFLRRLVEFPDSGNSGIGYDVSYVGPTTDLNGRLRFENRYYRSESDNVRADVVILRHVIEHVPDPVSLLRSIRTVLVSSPRAHLFLEAPCVEWILQNRVIWDFFYEHCSYFSGDCLSVALQAAGFGVEKVKHIFGGQYLWAESIIHNATPAIRKPGCIPQLAREFSACEKDITQACRSAVDELSEKGAVAIWGAGAKGVTMAKLVDPERKWIACIVDINPRKQGCYLPGTGHPIVAPKQLADYHIKSAILMNPNYREENLRTLKDLRVDIALVDPMERRTFETNY
jgi:SAM-dependent methyltransferase